MKTLTLLLLLSCIPIITSFGQLSTWNFNGGTLVASSSDPMVTADNALPDDGLSSIDSYNTTDCTGEAWNPSAWSSSTTVDIDDDYTQYTITANAGCTMEVTGVTFSARRTSTGPADYEVRSSADNYSATLISGNISETNCDGEGGSFTTINISAGGSISFRIYGFNASSGSGRKRIDDVSIGGSITCPMPVELTSFKAEIENKQAILTWTTLSETNNSHFEIEHRTESSYFKSIGTVSGKGNSTERNDYFFRHTPLPGTNYYRLKQYDLDGAFSYSKTISTGFTKMIGVSIYPTPVNDRIFVNITDQDADAEISIYNMAGEELVNSTLKNIETAELKVAHLTAGPYFLRVKSSGTSVAFRFVKL